jgi:hypothetical protein
MYGVRGAQNHTIQEVTKEKVNNKFDNDKKHWKEWLEHLDVSRRGHFHNEFTENLRDSKRKKTTEAYRQAIEIERESAVCR